MHPLTKITDTLFCVEVPMDAVNIEVRRNLISNWLIGYKVLIHLPLDKFELLGYCTDKEISFEVDEFIEKVTCRYEVPQRAAGFIDVQCYKNYMVENQYGNAFPYHKENCKDLSFRSLLLSKGLYWDNPMPDTKGLNAREIKNFSELYKQWNDAEKLKINGKLVFLKLIKNPV